MKKSIYLDCEWFQNGKIFIVGYGNDPKKINLLFGRNLNANSIKNMLKDVDYVFFYGPDIAYLEKNYNIQIRNKFKCINLLKITNKYLKKNESKKLASLEKRYKIKRTTDIYKNDIRKLVTDWKNPNRRKICLQYNLEDVKNLILVKRALFKEFNIKKSDLTQFILK